MKVEDFLNAIGVDFYAGVPDSLLSPLCDFLYENYGVCGKHTVAANEGNAVALAAGHYIATGRPGLVYMQNSGIGNAINPLASLTNEKIYGITLFLVVGWRGEPGVHDEPQHLFQGEITVSLLELIGAEVMIVDKSTKPEDICAFIAENKDAAEKGRPLTFVVKKGALTYDIEPDYTVPGALTRERAIELVTEKLQGSAFVSTTGKASRELFEIRERRNESHRSDFLTVGSMGHASSIALEIAVERPDRRVVLIDGDGALVMHMGSLLPEAETSPANLIHVLINNGVHDSVGGMPTPAKGRNISEIAKACGIKNVMRAENEQELAARLDTIGGNLEGPVFLEIMTASGARKDLGRPTTTPKDNIDNFTAFLREK